MKKYIAYAKINLGLKVDDVDSTGYHKIESIVDKVKLHDTLYIRKHKDVKVVCDGIDEKDNLVYKVLVVLKEKYNIKDGLFVKIKKRIPIAGGMGGGSSDAASAILAANHFWHLGLSDEEMMEYGGNYGKDIPLFFQKGLCKVTNYGEKVKKVNIFSKRYYIIVSLGISLSTKEVFKIYKKQNKSELDSLEIALQEGALLKDYLFNDLQEASETLAPQIHVTMRAIEEAIEELELCSKTLMSGSGPTVFVYCASRKEQTLLQREIRHIYPTSLKSNSIY